MKKMGIYAIICNSNNKLYNRIRELYNNTDNSLSIISKIILDEFNYKIDGKRISAITLNKRWQDNAYIPKLRKNK